MESIKVDLRDLYKLANKMVLITGGCSGIGLSLVELLFSAGCNLIVGDLQAPPVKHNAFSSGRVFYRKTDVTNWDQLRILFDEGCKLQSIDIVVANAGINEYQDQFFDPKFGESGELLEPDYRVLDINLKGASNTVALAIHHFKDRGGSIIITASLAGYMSASGMPVYGVSKILVLLFPLEMSDAFNLQAPSKVLSEEKLTPKPVGF
jgi:NAD(P)-dependent dehydrogenase (short-subunit alcohol dehydrogenase family)